MISNLLFEINKSIFAFITAKLTKFSPHWVKEICTRMGKLRQIIEKNKVVEYKYSISDGKELMEAKDLNFARTNGSKRLEFCKN